ncbi:UDP-glucose dehydrogenase family protein [Devosia nitrariae]|uniref:UDP-glucose 6-dehydrogenase n=1 Tax=Devosia nitrariae TaxID=2071872 RepID=A0ABQ5WCU2_9HYPH|nr:UDP-glucose/GDP-mannose dehydrogenase family protein [Devosia nitrariae]GLQ57947.1 UDP-glucose/GDP-mannose dehydrogenase family protein [Devosia nitrariae]
MRVAIIGTGYVGLVSGACLAHKGHIVQCVDIDHRKIDMINSRRPPIHEAGLEDVLASVVPERLSATADLAAAVNGADLTMIAVGTPFNGSEIDLTYIEKAAWQIGEALATKDEYHVVVVKSTVVPGTTETVVLPILERASGKKAGIDFGVGMNPEFLKEGEAIADFMNPDRVVIGGIDDASIDRQAELYSPFPGVDIVRTTPSTAEMVKYTSNALLATLISFSNEIGNTSAALGVDAMEVMKGVHLDKRFSPILPDGQRVRPGMLSYLAPGCGFGGSCFPKDVKSIIAHGQRLGQPMRLLEAVASVNADQPSQMINMLEGRFRELRGLKVAVLGMAFKPGTDDVRESPAIAVTRTLIDKGVQVVGYDPIARSAAQAILPEVVEFEENLAAAVADADAILIMTAWAELRALPAMLADMDTPPVLIDGRRLIDKSAVRDYLAIGLPTTREFSPVEPA